MSTAEPSQTKTEIAVFAGGCFWCMQPPYDELSGVIQTTVGYSGGNASDAYYEAVSKGSTGHYESIQIIYDPSTITYQALLNVFWKNIDPTDTGGQFCDRGKQYRSAIFPQNEEQRKLAEESKRQLLQQNPSLHDIKTDILPPQPFYAAELYHQKYYLKNPLRYKFYRFTCGRDRKLNALWKI